MPHRRRALSPEQARRIRWAQRGILAVGLALLVWNVQRSWLFLTDDALISLRYTERLLQGEGLTWNDGERVEGYSNLLWVLILAVPGLLGLDLVGSAVGLGLLCAGLSLVVLQRALRPSGLVSSICSPPAPNTSSAMPACRCARQSASRLRGGPPNP